VSNGRVLVVDDSVVVRRLVSDVLKATSAELEIDVAATAAIALNKIAMTPPDVIILDVEMPGMTGIEALPRLRAAAPRAKVLMFSSLTRKGAAASLDAIALGAVDCVVKPASMKGLAESTELLKVELGGRVLALLPRAAAPPAPVRALPRPTRERREGRVELVAMGSSTGGPNALAEVLANLGRGFPAPLVMVQHMPPLFTKMLAERLDGKSGLRVHEAQDGDVIAPGGAWLAPGGRHLTVERQGPRLVCKLNDDPPENFCRPAVDVLFRSAARACGGSVLAVVLTGMGGDGARGAGVLRQSGAGVIVQDQATSVVWGMPGQVVALGHADAVLPLAEIGPAMARAVGERRFGARTTSEHVAAVARPGGHHG
jgi:two-component system chemotaxis response regulator CheB